MTKLFTRRQFIKGGLAGLAGIAIAGALGPLASFPVQAEEKVDSGIPARVPSFDLENRGFRLVNGMQMPILGLGTYTLMNRVAESSVYEALTAGYRLIDTAAGYGNERGVGQGVQKSGVPRGEIFLTTKLWPTNVA